MMPLPAYMERVAPLSRPLAADDFHFLRHGRTDHNLRRIVQGHLDIPLDDTGRAEALAAAEFLAEETAIRQIVSSDLSRARETAVKVADRLGLVPQLDHDLRERCFGPFQGHPPADQLWERVADGMETIEAFADRAGAALSRHLHGPGVLVVAHGGMLRIIARLLRADLPDNALRNAAPLRFSRSEQGWTISDLVLDAESTRTWEPL